MTKKVKIFLNLSPRAHVCVYKYIVVFILHVYHVHIYLSRTWVSFFPKWIFLGYLLFKSQKKFFFFSREEETLSIAFLVWVEKLLNIWRWIIFQNFSLFTHLHFESGHEWGTIYIRHLRTTWNKISFLN